MTDNRKPYCLVEYDGSAYIVVNDSNGNIYHEHGFRVAECIGFGDDYRGKTFEVRESFNPEDGRVYIDFDTGGNHRGVPFYPDFIYFLNEDERGQFNTLMHNLE